ncbi:hypothetical protein HZB05_02850 [Candidatus Wolfebacteria bacterium]|nr:hypothetical protein [Candidatus Wolfebacteria bacterium]
MDKQSAPNQPQQPQQQNIPTPPPLEIEVRSMESDIKSFQETGGEIPGGAAKSVYTPPKQESARPEQGAQISGYQGPEKAIFTPGENLLAKEAAGAKTGAGKTILIILGVLIGAVALGFLGYYVIFPLIF